MTWPTSSTIASVRASSMCVKVLLGGQTRPLPRSLPFMNWWQPSQSRVDARFATWVHVRFEPSSARRSVSACWNAG